MVKLLAKQSVFFGEAQQGYWLPSPPPLIHPAPTQMFSDVSSFYRRSKPLMTFSQFDAWTHDVLFKNSELAQMAVNSELTQISLNSELTQMSVNSELTQMSVNSELTQMSVNSELTQMSLNSEITQMSVNSPPLSCSDVKLPFSLNFKCLRKSQIIP
jgi:hypothetical protein